MTLDRINRSPGCSRLKTLWDIIAIPFLIQAFLPSHDDLDTVNAETTIKDINSLFRLLYRYI